ncbi:cellulose biosynthesis protein BcsN [Oricola sp.]|uniref:cellulose biosynthesis protein BcsN n=1 Tax=Oricola sp. TaxID=1979950 RepID=UPI0025DC03D6|nr:cellulose biosynthesis protein BcsN [Oricola sp.]MCI5075884.1 cellulose biosynthesis protein BcsN [Oricola sp.]
MNRFRRKGRIAARGAGLGALLALCGCAAQPVHLDSEVRTVGAEQAYIMPVPGSFAITGVVEQRHGNAVEQKIFLSTDSSLAGSNVAKVKLFGTSNQHRFAENNLRFKPLTERQIANDVHDAFPTVKMFKSDFFVQNEYGPFGYAMGRPSSGELCMYAWQQIRAQASSNPFNQTGALQIDVRLCKAGASENDLLAFMYGFTITAAVDSPGWNPFGSPPATPDRLGKTGDPIYPLQAATVLPQPAPVAAPAAAPVRKTVRKSAPKKAAAPTPTPATVPAVTVPSPGGGGSAAASPAGISPDIAAQNASLQGIRVPSPACAQAGSAASVDCP